MLSIRSYVGPHIAVTSMWLRYAMALAFLGATLLARAQLIPVLGLQSPLLAFVFPVLAAAVICGSGPAILIALLTPFACTPIFQPTFTWANPNGWIAHLMFFEAIAGVVILLISQLQVAYGHVREYATRLHADTEAARIEIRAGHHANLLQSIVGASGDAIVSETLDGRITSWNAAAEKLFGYTAAEALDQKFEAAMIPPDLHARNRETLNEVRAGAIVRYETERLRKDGTRFSVSVTVSLIRDRQGRPIGVCRIIRDITEQRRTLDELARSERRLNQLADAMPQIVYMMSPKREVLFLNERWREYTGCNSADPDASARLIPEEDLRALYSAWEEHAPKLEAHSAEFRLRSKSGEMRWFLRRAAPILNDDNSVEMWVGTSTDIHEQKLAQAALIEEDRRKNEFLAMLAHELRNPLAPVMNAASILQLKSRDPALVEQMSGILKRQISHLARLVDDLLDVSRITRDKIELQKERLIAQTVIERALETVHPSLIAKRQAIDLSLPPQPIVIDGDIVRLTQIVGNLLTNASKFSPPDSPISVSLQQTETHAQISVRDRGVGIDPQHLTRIFELFVQGEQSHDRSQGGLGIGLTIAKRLVELHGGSIESRSDGIGHGSEFIVSLPLARASIASHVPSASVPA